jgi:hypothetical protein
MQIWVRAPEKGESAGEGRERRRRERAPEKERAPGCERSDSERERVVDELVFQLGPVHVRFFPI